MTYELANHESLNVLNRTLTLTKDQFQKALCPHNFIELRTILWGPAPKSMTVSLRESRKRVTESNEWVARKIGEIGKAEAVLEGFTD